MNKESSDIKVSWTGDYPSLCYGKWHILINGKSLNIPKDKVSSSMDTAGNYDMWYFDDDYNEIFKSYDDGLFFDEWIKENREWLIAALAEIGINKFSDSDVRRLYDKIAEKDFRTGSCGGCI